MHYYGDLSLELQQHDLHSKFLCTNYSFEYEISSSSSSSSSTERVLDMTFPGQIAKHPLVCADEITVRPKRPICHTRQAQRRRAANIREHRRVQLINDAFEGLRGYIPTLPYEKHLTKVDTIRIAIRYIGFLSDMVQSDICSRGISHVSTDTRKVIIHCPNCCPNGCYCSAKTIRNIAPGTNEDFDERGPPFPAGYSLSWLDIKNPCLELRKKTLVAKVWTPEVPGHIH